MNKKALGALVVAVICLALCPNVVAQATGSPAATAKSGQASLDQDIQLLRKDLASDRNS